MNYPRQHTIDNPKLKYLLEQKTALVIEGREITQDIEAIEKGNETIDNQIKELEAKVDLKEFEDEAESVTNQMKALMEEANTIQAKIYDKLKAHIPPQLGEKYDKNKKLKESLERKRNKIGLKINKMKDLIIPLTQKVAKPLLQNEDEDFSDVRLENGQIVVDILNHVEDYRKTRKKKMDK